MANIEFPDNQKEISDRMSTVVKNELEQSNPFLRVNWLWALIAGLSAMFFGIYKLIKYLLTAVLPLTAKAEFAQQWGSLKGVSLNSAIGSEGSVTVEGTSGIVIPANTIMTNSSGLQYKIKENVTTAIHATSVTSLTRSGNLVTAITSSDHNFATNNEILISGADQTEYNGTFTITVTTANEFTYLITTTPTTPATGAIVASLEGAFFVVDADDFGKQTNQDSGEPMTFLIPIPSINQTGYVQFSGLIGGQDEETIPDFVDRYTVLYQNPYSRFNIPDIINLINLIPGLDVTRVFVDKITPEVGDFTVFFMLDNNDNPIPNATERQLVKDKLVNEATPNMADASIVVPQLTAVPILFTFTALNPDTQTMKDAIEANLIQFFKEGTEPEKNVTSDDYRTAIKQTIDSTGQILISFTLSAPIGDVAVGSNEIATFDSVSWV